MDRSSYGIGSTASRNFSNRGNMSYRGGKWRKQERDKPDTPSPPYGELLVELNQHDISESSFSPKIADCEYVASYSWLQSVSPTIIVPGRPPAWTPPKENHRLQPDQGDFFRDQNAARFPAYPMEPAVRAVLEQDPNFAFQNVNIFTCSSVLGNLSRFVRGLEKDFRFVMEAVGNTVFFIRREKTPTELIPDVRGFGHTFPDEYTSWEGDVKSSVSHQRIIRYQFGGLCLLVRFEADGYFPRDDETARPPNDTGSLIDALEGVSVGRPTTMTGGTLNLVKGGRSIPQNDVFDIKTRSQFDFKTRTVKKEIDLTDILPRLWVSQIPTLIVGFHDRGLFEDIRLQDMKKELEEWQQNNEGNLRQLATLLLELVDFASSSTTKLEVCRSQAGPLEIRRLAGESAGAVPDELKAVWTVDRDNEEDDGGEGESSGVSRSRGNTTSNRSCSPENYAESDDGSEKDFTACSAEDCGYCGHCGY